MKTFFKPIFLLCLLCFIPLIYPHNSLAEVDLPWSTTYDYAEWEWSPSTNHPPNYPEMDRALDGAFEGHGEQYTTAANMAIGGGGRGQRHWEGDGSNRNTGGVNVQFTATSKIWIRWYMRYESGFAWNTLNYDKIFYMLTDGNSETIPEWKWENCFSIYNQHTGADQNNYWLDEGWETVMGGTTSDGQWHCYEIYLKMDTNGSNGECQLWIDGVAKGLKTGIKWSGTGGTTTGWNYVGIGSNQATPSNGRAMAVDFDDIAISNTGYIGPLGGGSDTIPPSVLISSPTSGQTVSGILAISASASDNVGVAGVQFKIDGNDIGAEDTTSPYSISLDSTVFSDGSHTLTVTARDAAGNQASSPLSVTISNDGGGVVLFEESFEDASFSSRGWYDNTNLQLSTTEHIPGSTSSVEFHFNQGATTPTLGGAIRKKFTNTDTIYVSYYVKYSSNWEGSNKSYHPHEFLILSDLDGDWDGPAYNYLTTYIEQNEGEPLVAIQDAKNIDEGNIGVDLTGVTENRAVAGCNGDSDGYGNGSCYSAGSVHCNGKHWRAGSVYFQDNPGQYYKNDWHFIEAYIRLNSVSNGIGVADGVVRYWYDGELIIDHSDVVLRTGQHPNMRFNQFLIAPWIGDGSPVNQTFWVDNLTVAASRPSGLVPTIPPNFGTK